MVRTLSCHQGKLLLWIRQRLSVCNLVCRVILILILIMV